MAPKFAPPSLPADIDQGKFGILAQSAEQTLTEKVLFNEPKQLNPSLILAPPLNRDGAPPNAQHIQIKIPQWGSWRRASTGQGLPLAFV